MQGKDYLTEKEACDYLGISRGTLFNYVKRKRIIKYVQEAPRQILYKKSELDSLKQIRPEKPGDQTNYNMLIQVTRQGSEL